MGEGAVQGGHAGGVRRPVLPVLVQPLHWAELQEEPPGPRQRPTGGDHPGGRYRDTTDLNHLVRTTLLQSAGGGCEGLFYLDFELFINFFQTLHLRETIM